MTDTRTELTLTVLTDQASGLIRAEVYAAQHRARLDQAVRDAVLKLGLSVDEVSAATGYTPEDIRKVLADVPALDNLADLAGVS